MKKIIDLSTTNVACCNVCFLCKLIDLPLELLEIVLMRTYLMLYSSDSEADDDCCSYQSGKSRSSERRAFALLASVCSSWRLALIGWPQSPTPRWVRHQIKKLIERECRHTFVSRPTYMHKIHRFVVSDSCV